MKATSMGNWEPGPHLELLLLVGILCSATFLRFHAPNAMPPGPSHDELRMMDLGELIVQGQRPIHWRITYSAEPLYMYLLALAMPVWGFTPFGARLVTRWAGLLLVPVAHRFARRLFGKRAAVFTSGVLAVTWWPMFFSRVALRGITLPLTFTGAVMCLWRGLGLGEGSGRPAREALRWGWLAGGGALMGLTWYTFTAARGMVILLPTLLLHLALLQVIPRDRVWRVALVTLGTAVLVAAPFIYEVRTHPGAPETRLDQLSGVVDRLLAGESGPFVRQALKTAGVFLTTGDPNWRYNISGRPAFGPLLGALAMVGIAVSLWRWRQPRHAVLILWLVLGLAPSVLTPEAPSFVRGIGALPVVAVFPAIGAMTVWDWTAARVGRGVLVPLGVLLILLIPLNGVATFLDAFGDWVAESEVREIYQASLTKAFRDLNHSNLEGELWISEPFPDDRHLLLEKRVLRCESIKAHWFDASRALILPPAEGARRYLLADFARPDDRLFDRWMRDATVVMEGPVSPSGTPAYRLVQARGGQRVERELREIIGHSTAFLDSSAKRSVPLPAPFGDTAELLGHDLADDELAPGEVVHLTLYWRVNGPVFAPIASFAHLIDQQDNIVGQYDGFDVPPWEWESGAVMGQVYRFSVDEGARPEAHFLEVGLYNSKTMQRLKVLGEEGSQIGDRLVVQTVVVE